MAAFANVSPVIALVINGPVRRRMRSAISAMIRSALAAFHSLIAASYAAVAACGELNKGRAPGAGSSCASRGHR